MIRVAKILSVLSATIVLTGMSWTLNRSAQHDDIVDIASGSTDFSTLVSAVKAAGLVETLKADGPFTVFAPTNKAFAAVPAETLDDLLKPENRDRLQAILTFHVVAGEVRSTDLLAAEKAETVNGKSLPIGLRVGGANVVTADIQASNGIIHVIDRVLLPADLTAALSPARLIEMAISRGAPLYNHGQPGACAAVYEVAAEALLMNTSIPQGARASLGVALERMRSTHSMDQRAWIMRRGLDEAYVELMSPNSGS